MARKLKGDTRRADLVREVEYIVRQEWERAADRFLAQVPEFGFTAAELERGGLWNLLLQREAAKQQIAKRVMKTLGWRGNVPVTLGTLTDAILDVAYPRKTRGGYPGLKELTPKMEALGLYQCLVAARDAAKAELDPEARPEAAAQAADAERRRQHPAWGAWYRHRGSWKEEGPGRFPVTVREGGFSFVEMWLRPPFLPLLEEIAGEPARWAGERPVLLVRRLRPGIGAGDSRTIVAGLRAARDKTMPALGKIKRDVGRVAKELLGVSISQEPSANRVVLQEPSTPDTMSGIGDDLCVTNSSPHENSRRGSTRSPRPSASGGSRAGAPDSSASGPIAGGGSPTTRRTSKPGSIRRSTAPRLKRRASRRKEKPPP